MISEWKKYGYLLIAASVVMISLLGVSCRSRSRTQDTNTTGNITSENTDSNPQTTSSQTSTTTIVQTPTPTLTVGLRNVKFGKYNWRVLDMKDGKVLLLSENIVETGKYHDSYEDVTWENCDLRKYLNGEFMKNFSSEEQSRIAEVVNKNPDNQWSGVSGGNDTSDSIFLLSLEEVVKYFGDSGQLTNRPDEEWYINDQYNGAKIAKYDGEVRWWWLRSSGGGSDRAADVRSDGSVYVRGVLVDYGGGGIRPALWINQ